MSICGPTQRTPLFWACWNGNKKAAYWLMQVGANVAAQDMKKLNCLDAAVERGHKYVVHGTTGPCNTSVNLPLPPLWTAVFY